MRAMPSRDYYVVLNVTPQATNNEIKSAYRKLALQYHPDRNGGNVHTEALFKEINEAYRVLSDPQKKDEYNHLRKRDSGNFQPHSKPGTNGHTQSSYQKKSVVNGKAILYQCNQLRVRVDRSNPFAIDADSLFGRLQTILSDAHVNILLFENNRTINSQVLQEAIVCCRPLPANYFNSFIQKLSKLAGSDVAMRSTIHEAIRQKQQDLYWQKYKFLWVLAITLIICLLIYFM